MESSVRESRIARLQEEEEEGPSVVINFDFCVCGVLPPL